ncbi:MAG TPA: glycosyltransferase family 39 protein [Pyrinomonadaceae bacterium]|nr:glycosyltransferase family 39 protein [Pyrinomonadaceae bacterium]
MTRQHILIVVLFLAAAGLRFADVFRPINQPSWRECDLGAISRNFVREGMNPLYPRIDWRGDGPGFAEMELPLYPWLTALTYEVFGEHDQIGRVWAFLFSLGAMFFFFKIAREYLTVFASTVAFAFFALNPLMVGMATSIQPEGMMVLTYLASVYFFIKWIRTDHALYCWAATIATALTLLSKAPAAHIGLFFGVLLLQKFGWRVVTQARVWIFGIGALMPSMLWYFHAKNLWLEYGNSLGVSNEYHWIGWDFFTDTGFIKGIFSIELTYVWLVFGVVVGAFAIWRGYREETARHAMLWLASIFVFYLVAARTASEDWAAYYHVFSIAPVALLFGFAIKKLWDFAHEFTDAYSRRSLPANLLLVGVIFVVIGAILASLVVEARTVRANFIAHRSPNAADTFAEQAKPFITADGPILVSGGHCFDPRGYYVAYNASYMFYWLDKKGWNICVEDQSIQKLNEFRSKGIRYFVAEKAYVREKPGFEAALEESYPTLAVTDRYVVYDLTGSK